MGDMADDILDGLFCQVCGAVMEDVTPESEVPGYPRTCRQCEADALLAELEKGGGHDDAIGD